MENSKNSYLYLFIAIELKNYSNVVLLINSLNSNLMAEKIHWVQGKNLHLTIKYLGKTEKDKIGIINQIMQECCDKIEPFEINFGKLGTFGSKYAPKIVWLETLSNGSIEIIEKNLNISLLKNGFQFDRQNFVPHLTLAKIHSPLKSKAYFQAVLEKFRNPQIPSFPVNKIYLFSSQLTEDGPIYHIEQTFNLQNVTY